VVLEEQIEPHVELPPMEIEDNPQIIQARIDTPSLRRSSRRNLVLAEDSHPRTDVIKPKLSYQDFKFLLLKRKHLKP
jgi:hypothetical protein